MSYYQTIYNRLRKEGMTEAGALGVLGNWECESNCEPLRVQNDFSPYRTPSKMYVNQIESGMYSAAQFSNDDKGFGLPQWTYAPRKLNLFNAWKKDGRSIADVNFQLDFAMREFKTDFPSDLRTLCMTTNVEEACRVVCARFENPAVHNVSDRVKAANRIMGMIDLNAWQSGGEPDPTPTPTPDPTPAVDHRLKLRTVDYHCEGFEELNLLWSLLRLRNYAPTWECLMQFQRDNGLTDDGVVGMLTWGKLLQL